MTIRELCLLLTLIFADWASKYLVLFLNYPHIKNHGIILGWLPESIYSSWLYHLLLTGVGWFFYQKRVARETTSPRFLSLIFLAGALGNLLDKIWLGYVVDFLDFRKIIFFYPQSWPRFFNLADVYLLVGLVALFGTFRNK